MKKLLLTALILVIGFAPVTNASIITYTAGLVDDFALPEDPATPSAALSDIINNHPTLSLQTADYDSTVTNHWIAQTFSGLPENITGAILELKIKGIGGGVEDDDFWLGFFETSLDDRVYRQPLGSRGGALNGLATGPVDDWLVDSVFTLVLDLSALPLQVGTLNILPDLQVNRFLDVIVADDTAVDYMRLTITAVPEPATLALFGISLAGMGFARKKKKSA